MIFPQIFVFDGTTGENLQELGSPAHKGGIYAVSYDWRICITIYDVSLAVSLLNIAMSIS